MSFTYMTNKFPAPGNVLEFKKIRKCPGKSFCQYILMPVEENFDCRRKRVPVHSLDIPC